MCYNLHKDAGGWNVAKIVTAAVIVRDGRVLVARRALGQDHAGYWEFPGGKLEDGEDERACLARELREELAIEGIVGAHLTDSLYAYEKGAILLKAYAFDWQQGEMRLTVHDKIDWVTGEALEQWPLTPADEPIARFVMAQLDCQNP